MEGMDRENVILMKTDFVPFAEFVQPRLDEGVIDDGLKQIAVPLGDAHPEVFSPSARRHSLWWDGSKRGRLFVTQNRFGCLLVAVGAGALHGGVFVDGEARRIEPQFNKLPRLKMRFQCGMRNLKPVSVRLMHRHSVNQLVTVCETLTLEASLQIHGCLLSDRGRAAGRDANRFTFDLTETFGELEGRASGTLSWRRLVAFLPLHRGSYAARTATVSEMRSESNPDRSFQNKS